MQKIFLKLLLIVVVFSYTFGYSQQQQFFTKISKKESLTGKDYTLPKKHTLYNVNVSGLQSFLKQNVSGKQFSAKKSNLFYFPDANGKMIAYQVKEMQVMDADLAKKYPNNKSYIATSLDKKYRLRFSLNALGLYVAQYSNEGTAYLDPVKENTYAFYKRKDITAKRAFVCSTKEQNKIKTQIQAKGATDLKFRTFRLALAATGEYSNYHIVQAGVTNGTVAQKKEAVMAALTTTMTRVNGVFEKEVALTMKMVANNDELIFLDANSDPYTNDDGGKMLDENQTTIDNIIGINNYDLGHVFSTGGGGVAYLASPCSTAKAGGVTGLPEPVVGDPFAIDFVAHELGHQFGATHTFNSSSGSCDGNATAETAVEPGSGTTIMSYAGLCSPNNVQSAVNDYFNGVSLRQMYDFISSNRSTCDAETALTGNNNAPTADAGADFTVPKSTPLVLKGAGADADNDNLTFCWEQTDGSLSGISNPPRANQRNGALFRSLPPVSSSDRYLPALNTVLSGALSSEWEVLPSVARDLNFALTVRDNVAGGGQTAYDEVRITVDENSGPFQVISQNEQEVYWVAGSTETIAWDVANSNVAPVSCTNVNILLSLDGGLTYPIKLAENVANDGSHDITVPSNTTTSARVKVEGANHIFYALNSKNIQIANDYTISIADDSQTFCLPDDVVIKFNVNTSPTYNQTINFSVNNLPGGTSATFNPTSANASGEVTLTISNLDNVRTGVYTVEVVATSNGLTRKFDVDLTLLEPTFKALELTAPENMAIGILARGGILSWNEQTNAQNYDVEISTDAGFGSLVESKSVEKANYTPENLTDATTYYWRVRPKNRCKTGEYSEVYSFTTSKIECNSTENGTKQSIPDFDANGVVSSITIDDDFLISDVNVTVDIEHSYISDLIIYLESPSGKQIQLYDYLQACEGTQNMSATFDDLGQELQCASSDPAVRGLVVPKDSLNVLNGDQSKGEWKLQVIDAFKDDSGSLVKWSLELCKSVDVASNPGNPSITNFMIYPNPSEDGIFNLTYTANGIEKTVVKIYDAVGRLIYLKEFKNQSSLFNDQIIVNNFSKGLYFAEIKAGTTTAVKRLVIK